MRSRVSLLLSVWPYFREHKLRVTKPKEVGGHSNSGPPSSPLATSSAKGGGALRLQTGGGAHKRKERPESCGGHSPSQRQTRLLGNKLITSGCPWQAGTRLAHMPYKGNFVLRIPGHLGSMGWGEVGCGRLGLFKNLC